MSDSDIVNRLRDVTDIDYASTQTIKEAARKIESLEAELAAMRQRVEWRPIETAPKDGTRLILATISDGDVDSSSGYWTDHNGGGWVRFMPWQPTHWLPLPPIPTDTKETGE